MMASVSVKAIANDMVDVGCPVIGDFYNGTCAQSTIEGDKASLLTTCSELETGCTSDD